MFKCALAFLSYNSNQQNLDYEMHFTSVSYVAWKMTVKHMETCWGREFYCCFLDRASGLSQSLGEE